MLKSCFLQASNVRYVGVTWFVVNDLQFLPIRLTKQNSCCISTPTTKRVQKTYQKPNIPLFRYGHQNAHVDLLTGYIGSPSWRMSVDLLTGYIGPPNWRMFVDLLTGYIGSPSWRMSVDLLTGYIGPPNWRMFVDLLTGYIGPLSCVHYSI
jgi:hypothetical protein